jgi:hypothetical protein
VKAHGRNEHFGVIVLKSPKKGPVSIFILSFSETFQNGREKERNFKFWAPW